MRLVPFCRYAVDVMARKSIRCPVKLPQEGSACNTYLAEMLELVDPEVE